MEKKQFNWAGMVVFAIAALSIALDQITKVWVRANIPLYTSWNPIAWLEPIVTLTHLENSGAAFGLFKGMSIIFVFVALAVIIGVMVFYRQLAAQSLFMRVAFGLQLGGAMGNLIDRLLFNGVVTDFIDIHVWPIFNIADSSVVVGTALLAYFMLFMDEGEQETEPGEKPVAKDETTGDAQLATPESDV